MRKHSPEEAYSPGCTQLPVRESTQLNNKSQKYKNISYVMAIQIHTNKTFIESKRISIKKIDTISIKTHLITYYWVLSYEGYNFTQTFQNIK